MLNKNKIVIGIICGLVVPFVAYALILSFYEFADGQGWFGNTTVSETFRKRTQGLLAIAANLITINFFRRKRHDHSMRGVVIATSLFIILWFVMYYKTFLS